MSKNGTAENGAAEADKKYIVCTMNLIIIQYQTEEFIWFYCTKCDLS